MLNEDDSLSDRTDRLEAAGRRITGAFSLWDHWSEDERRTTVLEFLKVPSNLHCIIIYTMPSNLHCIHVYTMS